MVGIIEGPNCPGATESRAGAGRQTGRRASKAIEVWTECGISGGVDVNGHALSAR